MAFTSPSTLDTAGWRDAVSRVGLTVQERQLPRGAANTATIDMSPEQQAEWCQQVAIKRVEDAIGGHYEIRSTESCGPKVGEEMMRQLRDGEDVDKIEEQLEVRRPSLALPPAHQSDVGHDRRCGLAIGWHPPSM